MQTYTAHFVTPKPYVPLQHILSPGVKFVHGGDEMCCQRRYNLSPATNCAGATKCAVTSVFCLCTRRNVLKILRPRGSLFTLKILMVMWSKVYHWHEMCHDPDINWFKPQLHVPITINCGFYQGGMGSTLLTLTI